MCRQLPSTTYALLYFAISAYILFLCLDLPTVEGLHASNDVENRKERITGHLVAGQLDPKTFIEDVSDSRTKPTPDSLSAMIDALDVMQEQYFEIWIGVWETAIDWTSAVLGSYVAAALSMLSIAQDHIEKHEFNSANDYENLINRHFSQLMSYYFGQDAFALRGQAFDDMLWVVLGWVDTIKFIKLHSAHFETQVASNISKKSWHGEQWIPSFAHRARLFWDFASRGWDAGDCDGGMIWSPYLTPYKNAITNELYITASISMYLYFPGDDNASPFVFRDGPTINSGTPVGPQDPKYLKAAIEGYKWLYSSNMTNSKGLFVDGFHIEGYEERKRGKLPFFPLKCNVRNDMVYTYNQGVILSGQRGLWDATGERSYLADGHVLIQSVINATGYDIVRDRPQDELEGPRPGIGRWHGLGRSGILEEACDALGYCNQDGQTFKGIFFHHLAVFCSPLSSPLIKPGEAFDVQEYQNVKIWHDAGCAKYGGWINRNAQAALKTRNEGGKFGMWWGAPARQSATSDDDYEIQLPENAIDYRNRGVPEDSTWRGDSLAQQRFRDLDRGEKKLELRTKWGGDANDRGRGRTVETQGGGISVLRALWEVVDLNAKKVAAVETE